jgi:hypothetical protein
MSGPSNPNAPTNGRDTVFNRSLRYEVAGEEGRALIGSYAFAFTLGVAWLLFVYFGPRTLPMQLLPTDERPIAVTFDNLEALPEFAAGEEGEEIRAPAPAPVNRAAGRRGDRAGNARSGNAAAIADAFGGRSGTGLVGDVSNVLRGVDVSSGAGGTDAGSAATRGGKVVLGSGEGGQGSRTPGRGGIAGGLGESGGAGSGIGGVGPGGGNVSRTPVRIAPPRPIDAPAVGGVQRDVAELGTFVRGHESQLRFCYNEFGLKVNPSLAGSVSAAVTLTPGGGVSGVNMTNRSWSGAGASETEQCLAQKIRGWRFPTSDAGGGTYSFSFSFTR